MVRVGPDIRRCRIIWHIRQGIPDNLVGYPASGKKKQIRPNPTCGQYILIFILIRHIHVNVIYIVPAEISVLQVSVFGGYRDPRGEAIQNSMSLLTAFQESDRTLEVRKNLLAKSKCDKILLNNSENCYKKSLQN